MPSRPRSFPVELGSVPASDALVGQLHRLAMAGGPGWGLAKLLRRGEGMGAPGGRRAGTAGRANHACPGHLPGLCVSGLVIRDGGLRVNMTSGSDLGDPSANDMAILSPSHKHSQLIVGNVMGK